MLVSGGGTNLQALLDAQDAGKIQNGKIACVISSTPDAYALERAKRHGVGTRVVCWKDFAPDRKGFSAEILRVLQEDRIDLVVYAGFMVILDELVSKAYPNRMMNVHPALIPSFCGKGFYGLHVHEAVLESGVKLTGATVHFVNEICDGGPIILQKAVPVEESDTPETLQRRVMEQAEWEILPEAVSLFCSGRLEVTGNKVHIKLK